MVIKFLINHMDHKEDDVVDFKNNNAQAEYFLAMKVAEEVAGEKTEEKKEKKDKK